MYIGIVSSFFPFKALSEIALPSTVDMFDL